MMKWRRVWVCENPNFATRFMGIWIILVFLKTSSERVPGVNTDQPLMTLKKLQTYFKIFPTVLDNLRPVYFKIFSLMGWSFLLLQDGFQKQLIFVPLLTFPCLTFLFVPPPLERIKKNRKPTERPKKFRNPSAKVPKNVRPPPTPPPGAALLP